MLREFSDRDPSDGPPSTLANIALGVLGLVVILILAVEIVLDKL